MLRRGILRREIPSFPRLCPSGASASSGGPFWPRLSGPLLLGAWGLRYPAPVRHIAHHRPLGTKPVAAYERHRVRQWMAVGTWRGCHGPIHMRLPCSVHSRTEDTAIQEKRRCSNGRREAERTARQLAGQLTSGALGVGEGTDVVATVCNTPLPPPPPALLRPSPSPQPEPGSKEGKDEADQKPFFFPCLLLRSLFSLSFCLFVVFGLRGGGGQGGLAFGLLAPGSR